MGPYRYIAAIEINQRRRRPVDDDNLGNRLAAQDIFGFDDFGVGLYDVFRIH